MWIIYLHPLPHFKLHAILHVPTIIYFLIYKSSFHINNPFVKHLKNSQSGVERMQRMLLVFIESFYAPIWNKFLKLDFWKFPLAHEDKNIVCDSFGNLFQNSNVLWEACQSTKTDIFWFLRTIYNLPSLNSSRTFWTGCLKPGSSSLMKLEALFSLP